MVWLAGVLLLLAAAPALAGGVGEVERAIAVEQGVEELRDRRDDAAEQVEIERVRAAGEGLPTERAELEADVRAGERAAEREREQRDFEGEVRRDLGEAEARGADVGRADAQLRENATKGERDARQRESQRQIDRQLAPPPTAPAPRGPASGPGFYKRP
jgi:hypothetical protein